MQVDIDRVVAALTEQIANLFRDNAILRVLVSQLEAELESVRAAQVKEKAG
jgi:hypothetical protein